MADSPKGTCTVICPILLRPGSVLRQRTRLGCLFVGGSTGDNPDVAEQLTTALGPIASADKRAVVDVINDDRLVGQPAVTEDMLDDALAGRSPVDEGWWADLTDLITLVAVDPASTVLGVVSFARRDDRRAGVLLWLHAHEEREVVETLVDHVFAALADCEVITAFEFASALGVGLEALPVGRRPVTHAVLQDRSFVATDLWRYMHRSLPAVDLPRATALTIESEDDRRHLRVRDAHGATVGEATVGQPVAGVGVLWWLHVEPNTRGQGLGMELLGSALDLLSGLGADEAILYVDDDEPGGERDRRAANRLYDRAGFTQVDRLHSYRRQRS
jgi:ribosomal protein S18 acetylase RimI-like enzyme